MNILPNLLSDTYPYSWDSVRKLSISLAVSPFRLSKHGPLNDVDGVGKETEDETTE